MDFLYAPVILLVAAVILVPIAKRLGFGSVLGYLAAGLIIGPAGLRLVTDVQRIGEVSELGVVMLLFLIGLELRPARLWVMRRSVLGSGAAQLVLTACAITGIAHLLGLTWPAGIVLGFGLALSSTAIVLPMLAERELLQTQAGRESFSVLLFQDLAVIPFIALMPIFEDPDALAQTGIWPAVARAVGAIIVVMIGGRYLVRPIFRAVDGAKTPEIFTATALLIVIGTATLVSAVGLSMSLGAFMAGVVLSDSEYRHELQADIRPFEGLLLGVFFISVGMAANLGLLLSEPLRISEGVAVLLAVKASLAFLLARLIGHDRVNATRFALAISQAGEFGFVIFGLAAAQKILTPQQSEIAMLIITLSMIASPLLFLASEHWLIPRLARTPRRPFDVIEAGHDPVIICGFGRMGQIIGRILRMHRIPFTALDKNAEQVELVRRFGTKAYYGDPTRLDLLRAAGAAEARILVLALDDPAEALQVVAHAKRHFPQLVILARARNRRHVHLLMEMGVVNIVRETFHSSLKLTEDVLRALGISADEARRTIDVFAEHDERVLKQTLAFWRDEKKIIQTQREAADELRGLFEADRAEATDMERHPSAAQPS